MCKTTGIVLAALSLVIAVMLVTGCTVSAPKPVALPSDQLPLDQRPGYLPPNIMQAGGDSRPAPLFEQLQPTQDEYDKCAQKTADEKAVVDRFLATGDSGWQRFDNTELRGSTGVERWKTSVITLPRPSKKIGILKSNTVMATVRVYCRQTLVADLLVPCGGIQIISAPSGRKIDRLQLCVWDQLPQTVTLVAVRPVM